jgi:hypothetical protein
MDEPQHPQQQQQAVLSQQQQEQQQQTTANPLLDLDLFERRLTKVQKKLTRAAFRHTKLVQAAEQQVTDPGNSSERVYAVVRVQELALTAIDIRSRHAAGDLQWVQLAQRVAADRAGVAAAAQQGLGHRPAAGAGQRQQQQQEQQQEQGPQQEQQQQQGQDQEQQQLQQQGEVADGGQAGQLGRTGRSTAAGTAAAHAALLPEFADVESMLREMMDLSRWGAVIATQARQPLAPSNGITFVTTGSTA